MKTAALILIFLAVSCVSGFAENEPRDFNTELAEAMAFAQRGRLLEAAGAFASLLEKHPDEWLVYEGYAAMRTMVGDYEGAIALYEQAAERIPDRAENIRQQIRVLRSVHTYRTEMASAPPWAQAKSYSTRRFVIQTNIPAASRELLIKKITELFDKALKLYETMLGPAGREPGLFRVLVPGRVEEYMAIAGSGLPSQAFYNPEDQNIVIRYDGVIDWASVAHELAHFILRDLYISEPSAMVDEGLAYYAGYELEKEDSWTAVSHSLEHMNWLFDQGQVEGVMSVFDWWEKFETSGPAVTAGESRAAFHEISWTLAGFFMTTKDPAFRGFFLKYLEYEKGRASNTVWSAKNYFAENLASEQLKAMDAAWSRYVLDEDYRKAPQTA